MKEIVNTVADYYELYPEKLFLKTRTRSVVKARQVSMYIIREITGKPFQEVGRYFNLDHATVLHSVKTVKNEMSTNKDLKNEVLILIFKCKQLKNKLAKIDSEFCNPCYYGRQD